MDELVARVIAGDREAFARVVERDSPRLRAYVACRLRDPEAAEDLAQEAFIVAYRRLAEFDQSRDFYAWLRGIARNLVLNERRKLSREAAAREELLAQSAGPLWECDGPKSSIFEALARCMARVSERMREFLKLRYDQGLELAQIAERTGITAGSARVAHVRLLRSLRECVEQSLAGEPGP